ncbi:MAG: ribonuclease HII [Parcubacteria group bacterium Gr01-1014_72]|nr:MAG: ribonuclease HII [Parcubacteria group bacterium Gr01-1014_72]
MSVFSRRFVVGIDEAGRGPLAGPVSVGVSVLKRRRLRVARRRFRGLKDSKKLSEAAREAFVRTMRRAAREGLLRFSVALVGNQTIDRCGIVAAVNIAMRRALLRLRVAPERCEVLLDGALRAPKAFTRQKTIIGGDATKFPIMLAAVAAKVRRDRSMRRLARRYPKYSFEIHKGYGTALHYRRIRRYGLSPVHRRTFLKKIVKNVNLKMKSDSVE